MIGKGELELLRDGNRALGRQQRSHQSAEDRVDLDTLGRVIDAYTEFLMLADESEHVPIKAVATELGRRVVAAEPAAGEDGSRQEQVEQLAGLIQEVAAAQPDETKLCTRCGPHVGPKPISEFGTRAGHPRSWCKCCENEVTNERAKARRAKARAERDATAKSAPLAEDARVETADDLEPVEFVESVPVKQSTRPALKYIDGYGAVFFIAQVHPGEFGAWRKDKVGKVSWEDYLLPRKTYPDFDSAQIALDNRRLRMNKWSELKEEQSGN